MKIGLVYTVVNPAMCSHIEGRLRAILGDEAEWISFSDPTILDEVMQAGRITPTATQKLLRLYLNAMEAGAEAILSVCSSVGEVADAMVPLNILTGVPVVRIDSDMCKCVAQKVQHIAAVATFPTALEPTVRKIAGESLKLGHELKVDRILIEGGFGKDSLQERIYDQFAKSTSEAQALVLCQASMAVYQKELELALGIPVFVSPDYGIQTLAKFFKTGKV